VPECDFQLSARVTAGFTATFDAGVLLLWLDERRWGKLCFEWPGGSGPAGTNPGSDHRVGGMLRLGSELPAGEVKSPGCGQRLRSRTAWNPGDLLIREK
jgi:hypothetical protein